MDTLQTILEQSEYISDCFFNECLINLFDSQNKQANKLFKFKKTKNIKKPKK